ncbi:hypothetical protein EON65_12715 [archaeon]|nr:MAG: hypothetical protein EON65_12715 [archaeon]
MIFHVPVTGTWLIPNDRTRKVEDDWLFWKGKYYDPSFVYTLHYGGGNATATDLLPLCPLRMGRWNSALNPSSVKPSADSEDGSILLSCGYYDNMCGEREYLDIDLGSICHVTKLVSTGCYPSNLKSFPKFQSPRGLRGHDMHRMHEKRKGLRRKQVWVIEDTSTLSWVTRYEVMYRNQKGKWLKYSSIFEGNVDVATERAHAVDFIARYVRIIPLDCHVRKAMTMNVFGIAGVNAKKYREAPVGTEESNEVIIYELEAPQASKYRPIGSHKSLFERHEKARNNARRQTSLRRDLCYTMKHEL